MRKYPEEYLQILRNNTRVIENNGVNIILKPIPGEDREGYLDPYEKEIMDEHWASKKNDDNDKNICLGKEPSFDEIISSIRDGMGFANYNLNTVEIYTKFETLMESGNEVGVWRYYPRNLEKTNNNKALVFFHGGGWIGGTPYVVENFCKLISEKANCVVFNVDYTLAPEGPFPTGLNDNYCTVKHIYNNAERYGINKNKISVAGDSAGGNYAAVVALKARDEEIPMIAMQILIYPAIALGDASIDGYKWDNADIEIAEELEDKVRGLTNLGRPDVSSNDPIIKSYLTENDLIYNPYVSPMLAKSHANLPKAILVGAEFDGLRIQTEFYAKLLKEAGVDVTCYRYRGTTHAFIDKLGFIPQAEDLVDIISEEIKKL